MAEVSKATLKTYFQDGKEPDENKFIDLIDTMALVSGVPGNFTIGDGTDNKAVSIDGGVNQWRALVFKTAGLDRWIFAANATAESGSNAGSDLDISARKDDGTWLINPIKIIRSTGDIILSSDLYNVPWTNHFSLSTKVGWASFIVSEIYYKRLGNLVFVDFVIWGTSGGTNGAIATFTLPYAVSKTVEDFLHAMNNGSWVTAAMFSVSGGSDVVNLWTTTGAGGWTPTGNKRVSGQFWYEAN
jgi:hypothetical protein